MSDQAPDNADSWTDERKAATANAGAATQNLNRAIAGLEELAAIDPDVPPAQFLAVAAAVGAVAQTWAILDLAEQTRIGNLLELAGRLEAQGNRAAAAELVDQAADALRVQARPAPAADDLGMHERSRPAAPLPYPAELGEGLGQ